MAHEPAPLALATSSPKPRYPSTYSSSLLLIAVSSQAMFGGIISSLSGDTKTTGRPAVTAGRPVAGVIAWSAHRRDPLPTPAVWLPECWRTNGSLAIRHIDNYI
jgi:hypothetical protein